jgi:hypothetical protein
MAYRTRTSDNTATKKQYDGYIEYESYDSDDEKILPSLLVSESDGEDNVVEENQPRRSAR